MALSYPILIKARLSGIQQDNPVFIRLIKLMENITFRSLIRGGRADITSRLQHVLQQEKKQIDQFFNLLDTQSFNHIIDTIISNLKNDNWWGYWNDEEMLDHLKQEWFYWNRVSNYLLWRYEQYLCNDNYPEPKVDFQKMISKESIEHIAPQTEPQNLPEIKENGYGTYDNKQNPSEGIVSGNWMHCVGNLMLMAGNQNSSLGNKSFIEKLHIYGSDNLLNQQKEITEFISNPDNPIWDKTSIEKRRDKIVQAAQKIWSLDSI